MDFVAQVPEFDGRGFVVWEVIGEVDRLEGHARI